MPRPMNYKMSEETREKLRKAQIKRWHGEDWSDEDQKEFVRKRNSRHSNKWRSGHRDTYNACMRRAQDKFRENKPYYYRLDATQTQPPTRLYVIRKLY